MKVEHHKGLAISWTSYTIGDITINVMSNNNVTAFTKTYPRQRPKRLGRFYLVDGVAFGRGVVPASVGLSLASGYAVHLRLELDDLHFWINKERELSLSPVDTSFSRSEFTLPEELRLDTEVITVANQEVQEEINLTPGSTVNLPTKFGNWYCAYNIEYVAQAKLARLNRHNPNDPDRSVCYWKEE